MTYACIQDPSLFQNPSQSFRANLGSDDAFAGGIQGKLGRMGLEYVKDMYLEHNHTLDAETEFKTYNAGHVLITTAKREWEFVVGSQGVDLVTWTFDLERAEPKYTPESMVEGRNATPLRELMQLPLVKRQVCVLRKSSPYASMLAPSIIATTVCCVSWLPTGTRCFQPRST